MTQILEGEKFNDHRGCLFFNNQFDLKPIRRSYIIENIDTEYNRGWKGHQIEKRWFLCIQGAITIFVSSINNLNEKVNRTACFELVDSEMNVLFIPEGNATLIKQKFGGSRVMVFSDYLLGDSNDENLRWRNDHIAI